MRKIYRGGGLTALLAGTTALLSSAANVSVAAPTTGIQNVVLVHGAFADGSGWEAIANILAGKPKLILDPNEARNRQLIMPGFGPLTPPSTLTPALVGPRKPGTQTQQTQP